MASSRRGLIKEEPTALKSHPEWAHYVTLVKRNIGEKEDYWYANSDGIATISNQVLTIAMPSHLAYQQFPFLLCFFLSKASIQEEVNRQTVHPILCLVDLRGVARSLEQRGGGVDTRSHSGSSV